MTLKPFAIAYAAAAVIFLALDSVWLSTMADRLYRPALGHLLRERFALGPAAAFYLIYLLGIVVFAVAPGLQQRSWPTALGLGALLGLMAYATYDLTNQATLKNWPWHVTLIDLCWGTVVTALTAGGACWIAARFSGHAAAG